MRAPSRTSSAMRAESVLNRDTRRLPARGRRPGCTSGSIPSGPARSSSAASRLYRQLATLRAAARAQGWARASIRSANLSCLREGAVARLARAQDDHVGRSLAQRPCGRDRLQQAAVHHRLAPVRRTARRSAPGRAARPRGAQQSPRRSSSQRSTRSSAAVGRHRDCAELGPGGHPGLGERPAPADDLVEEEVEIDHGPASERARAVDERTARAVLKLSPTAAPGRRPRTPPVTAPDEQP